MKLHLDRRRLLAVGALLPVVARAQSRGPVEGTDFKLVKPPQPVESANKVEVLEFFYYLCPHCYAFRPELDAWRKKTPSDVDYRRVHINWDNSNLNHTKMYYALEQLGRIGDVHEKIFDAIHVAKKRLLEPNEIADLMAANGIDRKQFLEMFNSFTVASRVTKAGQTWRAYKVDGTPTMGCDGKFLTSPSMVGSTSGCLAVLDFLIQRARGEHGNVKK